MNADLAVCGFMTVFDEPSVDGRPAELREEYEPFAAFAAGVLPVRVNHRPVLTGSGSYDVGRAIRFALVDARDPVPGGVLTLLELDFNGIGLSVFERVASGELWGFSLGGNGQAEVSLTGSPAYSSCRVVGWGTAALTAWEILTGEPVDLAACGAPQVHLGSYRPWA